MIRQEIYIPKYDWTVLVFYAVKCYYLYDIMKELQRIGCSDENMRRAYENISACRLDTGLTYSNPEKKASVVVIGLASSAEEYENSIVHEREHLVQQIAEAYDLDPLGEEVCYLSGELARDMHPVSSVLTCGKCLGRVKKYR